jgi:hypothetical protein
MHGLITDVDFGTGGLWASQAMTEEDIAKNFARKASD